MKGGGDGKDSEKFGKPNMKGGKCAFCGELKGMIRIQDADGVELWICLRCDRLVDWQK